MKRLILYLWVILCSGKGVAQGSHLPSLIPASGAYSIHFNGLPSIVANPAALADLQQAAIGIYAERKFMLAALNHYYAVAAIKTTSGNFGLTAGYYGFADYNESRLGFAYARKAGRKAELGVQFNYYTTRVAGYGKTAAVGFTAGILLPVSDVLRAGICISDPVSIQIGSPNEERLRAKYSTGLGYEPSDQVFFFLMISKVQNEPLQIEAGIYYQLIPQLVARAAVASSGSPLCGGVGLLLKNYSLELMTRFHPQLGITPGILLLFNFKRDRE